MQWRVGSFTADDEFPATLATVGRGWILESSGHVVFPDGPHTLRVIACSGLVQQPDPRGGAECFVTCQTPGGGCSGSSAVSIALESGAPLENASITNGRLRIIGGTLRVDSGGSLIVVGTMSIDGTTPP
ncbi:hypothetical protein JM654_03805 [Microbacterium oxydans]|nr:hypothetical protein [Microbacterium oxydans]